MSSHGFWNRTPTLDQPTVEEVLIEGMYFPAGEQAAPVTFEGESMRVTMNSPEPVPSPPVEGDMALTRGGILVWREVDGLMALVPVEQSPQEPSAPQEDLGALADALDASAARLVAPATPAEGHTVGLYIDSVQRSEPYRVLCYGCPWVGPWTSTLVQALESTSGHPEMTNTVGLNGVMYPRREVLHAVEDTGLVHCACGWYPLAGSGSTLLDAAAGRLHVECLECGAEIPVSVARRAVGDTRG